MKELFQVSKDNNCIINYSKRNISNTPIVFISACTHFYAFVVFGAVFWVDSKAYVSLAYALNQKDGLDIFYNGIGTWFYSHIQPGLPLVWLAIDALPISWHWPTLSIVQHILGAVSLYYFFSSINLYWPSRWNYVGCLIVGFFPFYQAAHNSLMTESISSSLFLLGFSLVLRTRADATVDYKKILLFGLVLLLITQFRSYFGILLFGVYLISMRNLKLKNIGVSLILSLIMILSILAFPSYRYLKIGVYWLPSLGMNMLQTGWRSNPNPTKEALQKIEAFDFPNNLLPDARINKGLDYNDVTDIALHWHQNGLTDIEINRMAIKAGSILANDTKLVLANRVLLALTSSGVTNAYCFIDEQRIVFPGYSAAQLCAHIKNVYIFHSWLAASDQHGLFDRFFNEQLSKGSFQIPFEIISSRLIYEDSKAYLSESKLWQRDPLMLGKINPNLFIFTSFFAMLVARGSRRFFSLMCIFVIFGNVLVNFYASLGNPRYGYFLFPIYIGFLFTGISQVWCWLKSRWF